MVKAKTGIVKSTFKACLEGDVYPRTFAAGDELTGEALEIGVALKKMGGKKPAKSAGSAPENKMQQVAEDKQADAANDDDAEEGGSA